MNNRAELSQNGDAPGTLFIGSSNFTYRGLIGQGEMNDPFRDANMFNERRKVFDEMWDSSNSISIVEKGNEAGFLNEIKSQLWIYKLPKPFEMYVRVLHEIYGKLNEVDRIKKPSGRSSNSILGELPSSHLFSEQRLKQEFHCSNGRSK